MKTFVSCTLASAAAVLTMAALSPSNSRAANEAAVHYLNPPGLATPLARYSHAVLIPATEELIYVSGQGGENAKGDLVSSDVVEQTRQTMENLKRALEAAGSDFSHVVKMNIYLTDLDHMPELRKVRDAYLDPKRAPAMTTAKVLALVVPGGKVEIEVIAVRNRH